MRVKFCEMKLHENPQPRENKTSGKFYTSSLSRRAILTHMCASRANVIHSRRIYETSSKRFPYVSIVFTVAWIRKNIAL